MNVRHPRVSYECKTPYFRVTILSVPQPDMFYCCLNGRSAKLKKKFFQDFPHAYFMQKLNGTVYKYFRNENLFKRQIFFTNCIQYRRFSDPLFLT